MKTSLQAAGGFLRLLPVAAVLTSACSSFGISRDSSPTPPADAVAVVSPDPSPAPPRDVAATTAPAAPMLVRDPALEQRIADLELKVLEKDAQVEVLRARLSDARREVVRTMARVRTLATRDEAVSGIAEAELALQSIGATAAAQAVAETTELIDIAAAELDQRNYAGALYLANQAKSVAAAARGQLGGSDRGAPRADEAPFALPLHLQTTTGANVREGPGTGFGVLFTLPAGSPLVAYSSAEAWLRIADDSGRGGWIYQRLIEQRP